MIHMNIRILILILPIALFFAGCTPTLFQAIRASESDTVQQLLEGGADPNATDAQGLPASGQSH